MRKIIITFIFLVIGVVSVFAQIKYEPIGIKQKGLLWKKDYFVRCDVEMTQEQLVQLFLDDPSMDVYSRPMAVNLIFDQLLSSAAGLLIALPVANSLNDNGDPSWNLAYIGAGCLVASIPFKLAFRKKSHKAVAYYNSGYREASAPKLHVAPGANGVRLVLNF